MLRTKAADFFLCLFCAMILGLAIVAAASGKPVPGVVSEGGTITEFDSRFRSTPIQPVRNSYEVIPFRAIYVDTGTDGAAINNPYDDANSNFLGGWSKTCDQTSGRTLLNDRGFSTLEIQVYTTVSAAVVEFQIFTYDWLEPAAAGSNPVASTLGQPESTNETIALGIPRLLSMHEQFSSLQTMTRTSKSFGTVTMSVSNCEPYFDASGTTYYPAPPIITDVAQPFAITPYVVSVSSGNCIILARFRP